MSNSAAMRAMRAESFTGYGGLKLVKVPRPPAAEGRVLVRVTAAGVTPLDNTILSGGYPRARAPLILGNEGAGVVEDPGDVTDLIWKQANVRGLNLFAQSPAIKAAAWRTILSLLTSGRVKPIVERSYKLVDAAEALRHLIEDRPFGRVVLTP
jgi:NADPH:quinone reductase-like Zn-dependent oxidoreductase